MMRHQGIKQRGMKQFGLGLFAISVASFVASVSAARAEVSEVLLGQQFGAVFMPLLVMEDQKMVEKQLAAAGLPDVKVTWAKMGGPAALSDAMLSGNLHFSAQGTPSTSLLWDRTKGGLNVKALGAICSNNIWLNTKNPAIKTIQDITDTDRIGIPSLKVSTQALMLQIASEKAWGKGQHGKLDQNVVALAHPDSMMALLSPAHEVTLHFATSPFHEAEIKAGMRTITTAYEIAGGPVSGLNWVSHEKFRAENPKVFAAVGKALDDGIAWINADKPRAAKWFIAFTKDKKVTVADMAALLASPDLEFTKTPSRAGLIASFMHSVGTLKNKPSSWKDLYFEEAHGLNGS